MESVGVDNIPPLESNFENVEYRVSIDKLPNYSSIDTPFQPVHLVKVKSNLTKSSDYFSGSSVVHDKSKVPHSHFVDDASRDATIIINGSITSREPGLKDESVDELGYSSGYKSGSVTYRDTVDQSIAHESMELMRDAYEDFSRKRHLTDSFLDGKRHVVPPIDVSKVNEEKDIKEEEIGETPGRRYPLKLAEVRRTQRRLAALFDRKAIGIDVPRMKRRTLLQPPLHFCMCSRLDPDGKFRNPALNYLRDGLQNVGREVPERMCFTERIERKRDIRPRAPSLATPQNTFLPERSFVTSPVKDPYTGRREKGVLKTDHITDFSYSNLEKEEVPKLPKIPPQLKKINTDSLPMAPGNTPVPTADTDKVKLPMIKDTYESIEEDDDNASDEKSTIVDILVVGDDHPTEPNTQSISSKVSEISEKPSLDKPKSSRRSSKVLSVQTRPPSSGYGTAEPMVSVASTRTRRSIVTTIPPVQSRETSAHNVEQNSRKELSVIGSGHPSRNNTSMSIAKSNMTMLSEANSSITPLTHTPQRSLSTASSDFVRAESPPPSPLPPPRPISPAQIQLEPGEPTPVNVKDILEEVEEKIETGVFDFEAKVDINDVDTTLRLPKTPPPILPPTPQSPPYKKRSQDLPPLDISPTAAREAYIKALAISAARHRIPQEPWMFSQMNISRAFVFSYYDSIIPPTKYCEDCDEPLPPVSIKKKSKKLNEMQHIFKDVNIEDYYPGGSKNPRAPWEPQRSAKRL